MEKYLLDIGNIVAATIGGMLSSLMRQEVGSWRGVLLYGVCAGFIGFIVAKLCAAMGVGEDMRYVLTSLSGWIGANRAGTYLEALVIRKIGVIDDVK